MYRVDDPTAVVSIPTPAAPGTPGYYFDGNPGTSTPATMVRADHLNMMQEELMAIIAAASISPSKTVRNQVLTALTTLFGGSGTALLKANNLSDLASLATALVNLGFDATHIGSGYFKLPGGLIVQWGASTTTGAATSVSFPLTFPTNLLLAPLITSLSADLTIANDNTFCSHFNPTASGFQWGAVNLAGVVSTPGSVLMHWFALGN